MQRFYDKKKADNCVRLLHIFINRCVALYDKLPPVMNPASAVSAAISTCIIIAQGLCFAVALVACLLLVFFDFLNIPIFF